MSGSARKVACRTCRDRKVRCDGGQPSCEKCKRSNEACVYIPASTQSRPDLTEAIESLEDRMARVEAQLTEQSQHKPCSNSVAPEGLPALSPQAYCNHLMADSVGNSSMSSSLPMQAMPWTDTLNHVPASMPVQTSTYDGYMGDPAGLASTSWNILFGQLVHPHKPPEAYSNSKAPLTGDRFQHRDESRS
ncbi:uncharacterized protein BDZ99DRAFT_523664 [Mytilinidion resinicola]|uniref:Zn(2)-C6 fungal-type domain-containing protein n=1 Tax=Mytilinidion resinicola TaxID=574789 RepID=A0A6A6YDM4_9PEZI|nr:uncharacterized protein BDZ99DRAFT_523664 [Mytilinidion resinicola]KAF2806195.1 hypothetical protein BDZ99DRAFT_523664 [Mytilinidion resinicola]